VAVSVSVSPTGSIPHPSTPNVVAADAIAIARIKFMFIRSPLLAVSVAPKGHGQG
jgi:hypothetical protein